jgi:hypothetical protein
MFRTITMVVNLNIKKQVGPMLIICLQTQLKISKREWFIFTPDPDDGDRDDHKNVDNI